MRILKISGVVVTVHAAIFMLIFAIPGCRSGAGNTPIAADPAPGAAAVSYAGGSAPLVSPAPTGQPAGINATEAYPGAAATSGGSTSPVIRSSPSRPSAAPYPVMNPPAPVEAPDLTPAITYTVVSGDSLWRISQKHGLSAAELASANNLPDNAVLQIGQKLIIPSQDTPQASAASGAAAAPSGPTYTVRPGDNLSAIASRNNTTVAALRSANGIRGDLVRVGQVLVLPAGRPEAETQSAETPSAAPAAAPSSSGGVVKHVVLPGESLSTIAARYGVKVGEIALTNHITDPRTLRPGQELIIPGWQAPGGAASMSRVIPSPAPAPAAAEPATEPTVSLRIPGADQDFSPSTENVPVIEVIDPDAPQGQ